jgi:hypothetical protein
MSFANQTSFAAQPVPLVDREGRDVLAVVVKATFVVDRSGRAGLAEAPSPVRLADELLDPENPRSSLRFASDIALEKVGTDVVIVGDAVAPAKVKALDVVVKVKQRLVPLRVHGPRLFFAGAFGVGIGPAAPFERVPVIYERAYGGMASDLSVVELRNPSGVGVAANAAALVGTPAPQIEHPERPHAWAGDRHAPVGFGALMTHWSPRRERAGTFDDRWRATRMPLVPEDHDARYGNVAHPSLQFEEHLTAGVLVGIQGMSPEPLIFALPALPVAVCARFATGEREVQRLPIDTVVIEPEARRIELCARGVVRIGRGKRALREVVVRGDD